MKTTLALLFACATLVAVNAWWQTGHMLVAQVAKQDLLARYPNVYKRAEDLALVLKGKTNNLSDTFVESAIWMDDIKPDGWNALENWHYTDRPYNPLGLSVDPLPQYTSEYAVQQAIKVLNNSKTRGQDTLAKSIFIRVLAHVIGDIHQPLHSAQLFNLSYPKGDMGGNLEKVFVTSTNQTLALHAFWDAVAFKVPNDFARPLDASNMSIVEGIAKNLTDEFPRQAFQEQLSKKNVSDWTVDAYLDAVKYVYNPLRTDFVIDEAYQQQAWDLCRRNIALGGYRLADTIYDSLRLEVPSAFRGFRG